MVEMRSVGPEHVPLMDFASKNLSNIIITITFVNVFSERRDMNAERAEVPRLH
jgi:hypothetical protein